MPKQTNYNAGIYVRLSQEDERAGESLSIENQKMILTKYVAEQGWTLVDIYIDDGYSGTNFDRPGVTRLLDDAKMGKINLIICKDLSRFGRNYIEVGQYVDYIFPAYNIRFIALNDNVDTAKKDSAALDMMPIVNLFNEWHSASTSKKIRAVMQANAKVGKYKSSIAAYGYTKSYDEKFTPIVDPEAAEVVKRIFTMRSQGMTMRHIAMTLNDEHISCPSDYKFAKMNRPNPIYIGDMAQQKSTSVSYKNHKRLLNDTSEWVVVENNHEPIISRELWNKCKEVEEAVSRGKRDKKGKTHPLSGMMYCVDCGHKMTLRGGNTFNCVTYVNFGQSCCVSHYIQEKYISEVILEDIREKASFTEEDESAARNAFLAYKGKVSTKLISAENKKLHDYQRRISELDNLIQSAYEDKVNGTMPEAVCAKLLRKYEEEQRTLESEMTALENKISERHKTEQNIDEFIVRIRKYSNVEVLTREIVMELIAYITIDKNVKGEPRDIHIYYKYLDDALTDKRTLYKAENQT